MSKMTPSGSARERLREVEVEVEDDAALPFRGSARLDVEHGSGERPFPFGTEWINSNPRSRRGKWCGTRGERELGLQGGTRGFKGRMHGAGGRRVEEMASSGFQKREEDDDDIRTEERKRDAIYRFGGWLARLARSD
jgi:hypothetical protein